MARYSDKRISKSAQDEIWDEFCDLVVKLSSRNQVKHFFCDLLNRPERLMLARRLHVASLLEAGCTYDEIKDALGVGDGTIARVHRWLEFGRSGFRNAINSLSEKEPKKLKTKYKKLYHP